MKKNFFILFILFAHISLPLFSESPADEVTLSLEEALKLGYENNTDLKIQKLSLDSSLRKSRLSWNCFLPSLELSAEDNFNVQNTDEEPERENVVTVGGTANLILKADIFSQMKTYKLDYEAELMNYRIALAGVHKTICDLYFDIAQNQIEVEYKRATTKNLEELCNENYTKYQKGFLSENIYLTSKVSYEKSKSELSMQLHEIENLKCSFNLLIGLPSDTKFVLSSDLESLFETYSKAYQSDYQTVLDKCIREADLPEISLLELQKETAQQKLKTKKLENWVPEFSFSYTAGTSYTNPIIAANGKFRNSATAKISIPLDNFLGINQNSTELKVLDNEYKGIALSLESKKKNLLMEINNVRQSLCEKQKALATCRQLVEITKRNQAICQQSYSKGLLDFQSLKTANSEYLEAQIDYSKQLLEMLKQYSSLEQISARNIL